MDSNVSNEVPETKHKLFRQIFKGLNSAIISVVATKGGDGKSTTVVHLARLYASAGYRVLVIDMDEQCSSTMGLYPRFLTDKKNIAKALVTKETFEENIVDLEENLFLVPGSVSITDLSGMPKENLRFAVDQLRERGVLFDIVIVDTPGSWSPFTEVGIASADYILSPARCDDSFSQYTIVTLQGRISQHYRKAYPKWHVVMAWFKGRSRNHLAGVDYYRAKKIPLLDVTIPESTKIKSYRENMQVFTPETGPIFEVYAELAFTILSELANKQE